MFSGIPPHYTILYKNLINKKKKEKWEKERRERNKERKTISPGRTPCSKFETSNGPKCTEVNSN